MQRALFEPPPPSALEPSQAFNIVIAYEDFETGKHAKKTYDFLVEHLGQDCQFFNQMWKFDVLSIPKLREIAVRDALQGDIIMVSCHGASELPRHVVDWIESWSSANGSAIALVALFDCEHENCQAVRTYLAQAAKRAGIDFFAQPDEWPGHSHSILVAPMKRADPRTASSFAGVTQRHTTPRWGINE